jgi:IS30 family transposase
MQQCFPETTDLFRIPQRRPNEVARAMANRPRATLNFHSPAEKGNELLR